MFSLLLAVIYLSFISLGLPDSLLGSAWPVMHAELGVPVSWAGIVTMIISCGTIVSSLLSDRLTRRFGAGAVTAVSVSLTAAAMFGFSASRAFPLLCLWAVPYGLGAGAVDAALNNYVALHFASRHMNWLHCFWGVGAAISPYIMSSCLTGGRGWNTGYRTVGVIQAVLAAVLFLSLPLWKKRVPAEPGEKSAPVGLRNALKIPGVPFVLVAFFAYCAVEQTAGLWASSYLVQSRGAEPSAAAGYASLYFLGITCGRFLIGFFADRLGDRLLIRAGILVTALGLILVALPVGSAGAALAGLLIAGLGSAPIYPAVIHETPANFGRENSQAVIGIQMASAYLGTTFMPPLFGVLAAAAGIWIYPLYLLFFTALMFAASEQLSRVKASRR